MVGVFVCLACAVIFFVAARWGWSNASSLVPRTASNEARVRKSRVYRRGAVSCYAWAVALLVIAVVDVVTTLGR